VDSGDNVIGKGENRPLSGGEKDTGMRSGFLSNGNGRERLWGYKATNRATKAPTEKKKRPWRGSQKDQASLF